MNKRRFLRDLLGACFGGALYGWASPSAAEGTPSADDIVRRVLDNDPWGLNGATVRAHLQLTDRGGKQKELAFTARSREHDPPFSKSLVRFTAPADLAGAGFLQVQNREKDDDRFLFLPELKRARRISGNLRGNSFMGTDFSFADLDRRDLRESTATVTGSEKIGTFDCHKLTVTPKRSDSPYSRVELAVRKDNFLPLKMSLFDRSGVALKQFQAEQVQRISGQWFITRSKMINLREDHRTELFLDEVKVETNISDDEFTLRSLEKL